VQQPILYVDTSTIRAGKLEQLEAAMTTLAAFVHANMPRVISYGFFLDEHRTRMTVAAVHPDSASLEFHLERGAAEFRRFADLIELSSIDVYGRVSDAVLDRLYRKARVLGSGTVTVHELAAGFARQT
jgi:hypothetical protein